MRITRLHLVLFFLAAVVAGLYVTHVQREKKRHLDELAALRAEREEQQREEERNLQEKRRLEDRERQKELAVRAIAVAGEYWRIARQEGRDVTRGQETLRLAKEELAAEDFEDAFELADEAIGELKEASRIAGMAKKVRAVGQIYYKTVRGDTLWAIAKMPKHYGRGAMWTKIWRANEKEIPDFDLIYPRQVLLIPGIDKN